MRTRSIMLLLLIAIALIAFGPALIAVISQSIAEGFGCEVDLNRAIPCMIGGTRLRRDVLQFRLRDLVFVSVAAVGGVLFAVWLVAALAMLGAYVMRRRRARPPGKAL